MDYAINNAIPLTSTTPPPLISRFNSRTTNSECQSSGGRLADIRCASAVRWSSMYGACTIIGAIGISGGLLLMR